MPTLYTHIDSNIRRTWFLITLFLVFIIGLGYVFSYNLNEPAILYIAVFFSSFMSALSYWYSDKIVLALNRAREISHEENPEIYHIVENLCITAGLPMPKIYLIEEMAPNAFATGRNPEHAVIAVTQGLVDKLNRSEMEGVIAHELSHIGNRDILLSTVVVVLVGFVAILSDWFLRFSFWGGGRRSRDSQSGQLGAILALIGIILAILKPNNQYYFFEPEKKYYLFLKKVIQELQLNNITLVNQRIEHYQKSEDLKFDIVCNRAVSNINHIIKISKDFTSSNTIFFFFKGERVFQELLKTSLSDLLILLIKKVKILEIHSKNHYIIAMKK